MPRRLSDVPCNVLYSKKTKTFRGVEMIMCLACLGLTIFLIFTGSGLMVILMVLFATSLAFLIITLVDVLAACKNKQYTTPAWIVFATIAALMCFLCFGLMVHQRRFLYLLVSILFFLTGIVFLADGIVILYEFYKSNEPGKVHPIVLREVETSHHKQVVKRADKSTQELAEVPPEMRTYQKSHSSPKKPSQSSSTFPITSYGGTFPMGGRDEAPLPTPDNLTGMEPQPQPHVSKRTRDLPPETRSTATATKQQAIVTVEEVRGQTYEEYPHKTSTPEEPYDPSMVYPEECLVRCYDPYRETVTRTQKYHEPQGEMVTRTQKYHRTAEVEDHFQDEPVVSTNVVVPVGMTQYRRRDQCPCCCNRLRTVIEARDQASTVIKGAVKQAPQESIEDQQRVIQNQLEQMTGSYNRHHMCTCHDKSKRKSKRDTSPGTYHRRDSKDSLEELTIVLEENKTAVDQSAVDGNKSQYLSSLPENSKNNIESVRSTQQRRIFEDSAVSKTTNSSENNKRVTIGNLDIKTPSIASQTIDERGEFERWERQMGIDSDPGKIQKKPNLKSPRHSLDMPQKKQSEIIDRKLDDDSWRGEHRPTVLCLARHLYPHGNEDTELTETKKAEAERRRWSTDSHVIYPEDSSEEDKTSTRIFSDVKRTEEIREIAPNSIDPISTGGSTLGQSEEKNAETDALKAWRLKCKQCIPCERSDYVNVEQPIVAATTSSTGYKRESFGLLSSKSKITEGETCSSEAKEAEETVFSKSESSKKASSDVFPPKEEFVALNDTSISNTQRKEVPSYHGKISSKSNARGPSLATVPEKENSSLDLINTSNEQTSTPRAASLSGRSSSSNRSEILPRMIDSVQRQRLRESMKLERSREHISRIAPYSDGFSSEMTVMKEVSCKCICECICTKESFKGNQGTYSEEHRKITVSPLTERPYHPKDDFLLPGQPSRISEENERMVHSDSEAMKRSWNPYPELPVEEERVNVVLEEYSSKKEEPSALNQALFGSSSYKNKHSFECLPTCVNCPKRRNREKDFESKENIINKRDVSFVVEDFLSERPSFSSSIGRFPSKRRSFECLPECVNCPKRRERLAKSSQRVMSNLQEYHQSKTVENEKNEPKAAPSDYFRERRSFESQPQLLDINFTIKEETTSQHRNLAQEDSNQQKRDNNITCYEEEFSFVKPKVGSSSFRRSLTKTRSYECLTECPGCLRRNEGLSSREATERRSERSHFSREPRGNSISKRGTVKRMHPDDFD